MPFSKDPSTYDAEEHKILELAAEKTVTIPCRDAKEASYFRHRIYALRKALVNEYNKAEALRIAGKPYQHLLKPSVLLAPQLDRVTVGMDETKTILYVGRGASMNRFRSTLQKALELAGEETAEQRADREAKEFQRKLEQGLFNKQETNEPPNALDALGFRPEGTLFKDDGDK